jgi:DNA-binding NtrC family response regulator
MKNLNLLIIDDDEQITRMLSRVMKNTWKSITVKHSCDDGLIALQDGNFDIILSDWDCPQKADGLKIVQHSTIPFVIYTANSKLKYDMPNIHILTKPCDICEIYDALVNEWINKCLT